VAIRAANQSKRAKQIADLLEGHLGRPTKPKGRSNPLDTLIATLLSQNTNDHNSYKAWLSLKREFPTWEQVVSAPRRSVAKSIEVGGLKNQKAQRIQAILRSLQRERGSYSLNFLKGKKNDDIISYLMSMKGVGTKTAACVLVFSLGRDVFPVDTHIHRICNRLGLVRTKSADDTYEGMKTLIPEGQAYSFHVNLIRFGRETCRAGKPRCGECVLFDQCVFPEKERFAALRGTVRGLPKKQSRFLITEQISRDKS
jgi:endonuclease III